MTALVTASEYQAYDEKIREQVEILNSLLSAGIKTEEAADAAVAALDTLRLEVLDSISTATKNISSLADKTATEAARLLGEKFEQANQAADSAAEQYRKAGRWLGLKTFTVLFVSLGIVGFVAWLLVSPLLPSYEELSSRRAEIADMEARADELARRGVHLEWETCDRKMCFKTDGAKFTDKRTGDTFAVPYSPRR